MDLHSQSLFWTFTLNLSFGPSLTLSLFLVDPLSGCNTSSFSFFPFVLFRSTLVFILTFSFIHSLLLAHRVCQSLISLSFFICLLRWSNHSLSLRTCSRVSSFSKVSFTWTQEVPQQGFTQKGICAEQILSKYLHHNNWTIFYVPG